MTYKVNAGYWACCAGAYVYPAEARMIMVRTGEWKAKARKAKG